MTTDKPLKPFIVSVSARTLFDFNEEDAIFKKDGIDEYNRVQMERLEIPAKPGVAFSLIKKFLSFNTPEQDYFRVIISSKNEPFTGLRVFKSIEHHGLGIQSGFFTGGTPVHEYLDSFSTDLFLSSNLNSVNIASKAGIPSAHMVPGSGQVCDNEVLRLAFDIDCVIFGNESEMVFQKEGLNSFRDNEIALKDVPLKDGPFIKLLEFVHKLKTMPDKDFNSRIRTALITSRGFQVFQRPIKTLMARGINVDETFNLCGEPKEKILRQFAPDFYLDDQISHIKNIPGAGYVPDAATAKRNAAHLEDRSNC